MQSRSWSFRPWKRKLPGRPVARVSTRPLRGAPAPWLTFSVVSGFSESDLTASATSVVAWFNDVDSKAFSIWGGKSSKVSFYGMISGRGGRTPAVASGADESPPALLLFRCSSLACCAFSNSSLKLLASTEIQDLSMRKTDGPDDGTDSQSWRIGWPGSPL